MEDDMSMPGFLQADLQQANLQPIGSGRYESRVRAADGDPGVIPAACAWYDWFYAPVACGWVAFNERNGIGGGGHGPRGACRVHPRPGGRRRLSSQRKMV